MSLSTMTVFDNTFSDSFVFITLHLYKLSIDKSCSCKEDKVVVSFYRTIVCVEACLIQSITKNSRKWMERTFECVLHTHEFLFVMLLQGFFLHWNACWELQPTSCFSVGASSSSTRSLACLPSKPNTWSSSLDNLHPEPTSLLVKSYY